MDIISKYGNRNDGTKKTTGFFGEIKQQNGKVMTELSIGVNIGNGEQEIPLIVPGLSRGEINYLSSGGRATRDIIDKAVLHARERIKNKMSVFWSEGESIYKLPENIQKKIKDNSG